MTQTPFGPDTNLLLAFLPVRDQRRLLPRCEAVALGQNEALFEPGQPVKHVLFPMKGCLISLAKVLHGGRSLDFGPVGYDGFTGLAPLLGGESHFGATVRMGGEAIRMRAKDLTAECRNNRKWSDILLRYLHFLLVSVSQVAGCNRFHDLDCHFASLLLLMHDRIAGTDMELTHEVFSRMLGARRVGITQAAYKLQGAGMIRYNWGKLTILDRPGLEANACVCYRQITQAYQHLLDPAWPYR